MKVLLTGGGTGGHITPLLAVAQKLKETDPSVEVAYVGEHGSRFASMTKDQPLFDRQYRIFAGKFRRYHGETWVQRLFDIKTNLLNLRDMFYVVIGFVQSLVVLRRARPEVILLKGGFVGVPVGLAAALYRIPFITHDSDAIPGLANRLVGRWARYHATGAPVDNYAYPKAKTCYVGVLVSEKYEYITQDLQRQYRRELGIPADAQMLLVTGGSLGAQAINRAMATIAPDLLQDNPGLCIVHTVGRGNEDTYGGYRNERLQVFPLVSNLYCYSGAADLVVTRAGANTLAEFGVQGKACIVIPSPVLAGGHQLKNAKALADKDAVVVVDEQLLAQSEGRALQDTVTRLLSQPAARKTLGKALHRVTPKDATAKLADLIIKTAERAGE